MNPRSHIVEIAIGLGVSLFIIVNLVAVAVQMRRRKGPNRYANKLCKLHVSNERRTTRLALVVKEDICQACQKKDTE